MFLQEILLGKNINFVSFIAPKHQDLYKLFCRATDYVNAISASDKLSPEEKNAHLTEISNTFLHPAADTNHPLIQQLSTSFVSANLDSSLFLDILESHLRTTASTPPNIWGELLWHCRRLNGPFGRLALALSDETPSAYLPAENLYILLQVINYLYNIKKNIPIHGHCFFPQDMLAQHNLSIDDLLQEHWSENKKALYHSILAILEPMLADISVLPQIIHNFRLRFGICVIISLTNYVLKKYKETDNLQQFPQTNIFIQTKAIVVGGLRAVFAGKAFR